MFAARGSARQASFQEDWLAAQGAVTSHGAELSPGKAGSSVQEARWRAAVGMAEGAGGRQL